MRMVTTLES